MSKGVIWNLDGVLADTAEVHFRCWVTALAEKEIPLDRPTFDHLFGMNNRDILAQLLGRLPEPRPQRRNFSDGGPMADSSHAWRPPSSRGT